MTKENETNELAETETHSKSDLSALLCDFETLKSTIVSFCNMSDNPHFIEMAEYCMNEINKAEDFKKKARTLYIELTNSTLCLDDATVYFADHKLMTEFDKVFENE